MLSKYNNELNFVKSIQPKLLYHNYNHTFAVTCAVDILTAQLSTDPYMKDQLLLAAIYHDSVYVPGNKNNEELSSNLLLSRYSNCLMASDYIKQTSIPWHLSDFIYKDNEPMSILLDADLILMSASYSTFEKAQFDILKENYLTEKDVIKSVDFLKTFVNKGYVYRTEQYRKTSENNAMSNIQKFITKYEK